MNERYTIKILDTPYSVMTDAVERYVRDVKECDFPNEKEQY